MLQNRVDPFGNLITSTARGLWMGNRGVIHNHEKQIMKAYAHKAWIICKLEFKGRKRMVMAPDRWTELFFLDEATALSAGHRPCFECRRQDALHFKECWIKGNPSHDFTKATSINRMDEIIHLERISTERKKVLHQRRLSDIPDGTFLVINAEPWLYFNKKMHRWTPSGYKDRVDVSQTSLFDILTPNSIVNTLRAGYVPQTSVAS
jgi:hypothetical protein